MKKTAAESPDGESLLYEFVAGLLKQPERAIGGATVNPNIEKLKLYHQAPDGPPMGHYEGIEALSYMTAHSIPLIGAYQTGAMC